MSLQWLYNSRVPIHNDIGTFYTIMYVSTICEFLDFENIP